jgi:hypothetical protein
LGKLKLLYDVVMTMRDKEVFKGTLKGEGIRDSVPFFSFSNEFERNNVSGQTKATIVTEMDCDGRKVKHQSTTEFTSQCCHGPGHMHHGFMRHMHHHGALQSQCGGQEEAKCHGFKKKMTMLGLALNMLNSIKVEEQADKGNILTLNMKEIPAELKKALQERAHRRASHPDHKAHGFMKEIHSMDNPNIEAKVLVNKNNEVTMVQLSATGEQKQNGGQVSLRAELSLVW